jgi:hypothetical protein
MLTKKQKAARAKFAKLARAKHKGSPVGRAAASTAKTGKKPPKTSNAKARNQSPAQKAAFKRMLAARKRKAKS